MQSKRKRYHSKSSNNSRTSSRRGPGLSRLTGISPYQIKLIEASEAFAVDAKKSNPRLSINGTSENIYAAAQRNPRVARYLLKNYYK